MKNEGATKIRAIRLTYVLVVLATTIIGGGVADAAGARKMFTSTSPEPKDRARTFDSSTDKIYVYIEWRRGGRGAEARVDWYTPSGKLCYSSEIQVPKTTRYTWNYIMKKGREWEKGEWRAELVVGKRRDKVINFTVN